MTVVVLTAGTVLSVGAFIVAFVLRLAGAVDLAEELGFAATVALLATPAAGLVATAVETRRGQAWTAGAALLVLVILGAATALALTVRA